MGHQDNYFDMWAGKVVHYFGHLQDTWKRSHPRPKNQIKPAKNRVLWLSWPAYGKAVTQADITAEIPYIKRAGIDSLIIDDGWETQWGDWQADKQKFPHLKNLAQEIIRAKLKPGIWVAPFCVSAKSAIAKKHPEWLARDEKNKLVRWKKFLRLHPDPIGLDLQQAKVRKHIIAQLLKLGRQGFRLFKLDYLVYAFLLNDSGKKHTNTQLYHQFFVELRQAFKTERLPLEIMGCGGPISESRGLFEFMRFTFDTSLPFMHPALNRLLSGLNSLLYRDGFAVALERLPKLGKWYGLTFDGLHLFDNKILIDEKIKKSVAEKMLEITKKIKKLHFNFSVGDSLVRSELAQKNQWKKYLKKFKKIKLR